MTTDLIGRTLAHYEIVARLGAGGMGEVYLARDTTLDRQVALKVLPPTVADDPARLQRLRREAKALAAVDHPGIVTVFSVEEADGIHFLTMAYVKGQTLADLIPPDGMPADRLVELGSALADALRAAHEQGIVHRDLKPCNVMVDPEGRLRVLDFGLSRVVETIPVASEETTRSIEDLVTRRGVILGTVPYMSPEQAEGKSVGPPSDLFSLGVVLYEMATGSRPFHGDSTASLMSAILRDTPPPIEQVRADLPEGLGHVIGRCLAKSPRDRPASAAEVRDDLDSLHRDMILGADSRHRSVKRARSWALLTVAGAAVLVLATALGFVMWRGDHQDRSSDTLPVGAADESPVRSIAVLPLTNLTGDAEQEYFVDGMTEALIADLAQISALMVISRTSVMRFKDSDLSLPEIARELGVDAVVEGSVQRDSNQVRITAQLIDAATDRHLWADSFDRAVEDALTLQGDVARSIADAIAVELSPDVARRMAQKRPVKPATYDAYLRGMHHLKKGTPEGLATGMGFFNDAVDADPADPLAHAGLATGYVILGHATGRAVEFQRAKAAARRALELDPSQVDAQAALAEVAMYYDWDWNAADAAFKRVIELSPSRPEPRVHFAFLHLLRGDWEEAFSEAKLAKELDPLAPIFTSGLSELNLAAGRYERAEAEAREALELSPGWARAQIMLGLACLGQGRIEEALGQTRLAAEQGPRWKPFYGIALVAAGRKADARTVLEELVAAPEGQVNPAMLASFQALYGDHEGALATLEQGFQSRNGMMPWVGSWFDYGDLANDPRFQDLLDRLDLERIERPPA